MYVVAKCYFSKIQNHTPIASRSVFAKEKYLPRKNVTGVDIKPVVLLPYFQLSTTCLFQNLKQNFACCLLWSASLLWSLQLKGPVISENGGKGIKKKKKEKKMLMLFSI